MTRAGERTCHVESSDILLIEDDEGIRESIIECLSYEGYAVTPASNGEEGLARLAGRGPPSLIMVDLVMPVMNGAQFLERVRDDARLRSVPVVLMTAALAVDPAKVPAADGYLRKPFDLEDLLGVVERFCGPPPSAASA
jgi:CheY-like chemotaxis protein